MEPLFAMKRPGFVLSSMVRTSRSVSEKLASLFPDEKSAPPAGKYLLLRPTT